MSEVTLPTWHQTIDFNSLMVEARKHITELAGELWTDHNSSDPGITQLEVLAFCIADLSYRTSFDVKDILKGYKGGKLLDIDLPLADVALPNAPVTINDLRKVLIDMPNPDKTEDLLLRNAYPTIVEGVEVPFYAVGSKGTETQLSFENPIEKSNSKEVSLSEQQSAAVIKQKRGASKIPTSPAITYVDALLLNNISGTNPLDIKKILVNGLYGLQVEFEDQRQPNSQTAPLPNHLKDLNQNYFEELISVNGQDYTLSVLFPYWDEINWQLKDVDLQTATLAYRKRDDQTQEDYFIAVDKLNYDDYFYDYYAELDLNGHTITAFIKVVNQSEHEIVVAGKPLKFKVNFLDWNELSNGVRRNYSLANPIPTNAQAAFRKVDNVSVGEESIYDIRSLFTYQKPGSGSAIITKEVFLLTRITFNDPEEIDATMEQDVLYQLKSKFSTIYAQQCALEDEIYLRMQQVSAGIYVDYLNKINVVFRFLYGSNGIWSYLGKHRNLCEDYAKFSASRIQEIALFGKVLISPVVNPNELLGEIYYRIDEFLDPLIRFHTLSEMTAMGHSYQDIFNGPLLANGFILNEDLKDLKRRSVVYTSDLIRIIMDVPGVVAVEDFNISSYIDNRLMGRNVINCINLTNSEVYKPRFSADKTKLQICVNGADAKIIAIDVDAWYQQKLGLAKANQRPNSLPYDLELPVGLDRKIEDYRSIQHDFPDIYGIGEFGLPLDADDDRKSRAKQLKGFLLPFEQLLANYLKHVAHLPELFSYNRDVASTYATQPLYDVPDVQPLFSGFVQSNDTWETFKQDVNNSYAVSIKKGETEKDFRSRRNRFLSQLISRFGESFAAYSEQMFDQNKHLLSNPSTGFTAFRQAQAVTLDKLIGDKIAFGEEYEQVSGGRYQAFDTTMITGDVGTNTWQNDNIGDYKRRLCRLLGIEQLNNANLFGAVTTTNGSLIDIEGMHVLEHVLLRPRTTNTTLMHLQNQSIEGGGSFIFDTDKDPYSFRITIVLPLNAGRFQSPDFRRFTERLIRMETPAHIGIEFRWLPTSCGQHFEAAYKVWQKSIYTLKPWYFQQLAEGAPLPKEFLAFFPGVANGPKYGPTLISFQNTLIQALNSPCEAEMQLFNSAHQLLQEVAGTIRFEEGTSDVFHIKLSHPEGKLTVLKWNSGASDWELKIKDDTITNSYNSVEEYTGSAAVGLTEYLGGVGRYRVSYAHDDHPTLDKVIEVTPAPILVDIHIVNKDVYLGFDTETDGVFTRTNKNWQDYFLEFSNYAEQAIITISGAGNKVILSIPKKALNRLSFSELYQKVGAGTFRIDYKLGEESTFAQIELSLELSIDAFHGATEALPESNGITLLNAANAPTNFMFDVPKGTLTVKDLDSTVSVLAEVTTKEKLAVTKSLIGEQFVLYLNPAAEVSIDIRNDKRFVLNHHYLFEYSKDGFRTTRIFKWIPPKKLDPKVDFQLNGNTIKDEVVVLDTKQSGYSLSLFPDGYDLRIVTADGESVIEMNTVAKENLIVPLNLDQFLEYTSSSFFAIYGDDTNFIEREFTIVQQSEPVLNDAIKVTNSLTDETRILSDNRIEIVFEFNNAELFYMMSAKHTPGKLTLVDEDSNKQEFAISAGGLKLEGHFLQSDTYDANYVSQEGSVNFSLDVINPNPTFEVRSIIQKGQYYTSLGIPLHPFGKTYVWRIDGKHVSRAKQPQLTFDFRIKEVYAVELTLHYEDFVPSYSLKVTEELLQAWMNEQ